MQPEQAPFIDIFKEEAAAHIRHLHRGLLALQQHPKDATLLQEAARAADTLMGSAMTMDFEEISQQARPMRDRLVAARKGASPLDTAALEELLQGLEALCSVIDTVVGSMPGDAVAGVPLATVMALRTSLEQLHQDLVQLTEHPRDPAIAHRVCALAHTLRERAEAGGFDEMVQVAQRTEKILRATDAEAVSLNEDELGLLWQGMGFIELLLDATDAGAKSDAAVGNLSAMLDEMLSAKASETVDAVREMPTPGEAVPRESAKETVKVLIASNSTLFSRKLSSMLSQARHEVMLASDADEARWYLQHQEVDLCLLRDALPQGFAICEQFARRPQTDDAIPIILYSPHSRAKTRALESGAVDFLKVPCQPQELMALVDRWGKRPR